MNEHEINENIHKAIKSIHIIDVEQLKLRIAELEDLNESLVTEIGKLQDENYQLQDIAGVANERDFLKEENKRLESIIENVKDLNTRLLQQLKTPDTFDMIMDFLFWPCLFYVGYSFLIQIFGK